MPVFNLSNKKLVALNETKTRGINIEYPFDMKSGELLDFLEEFRAYFKEQDKKEKEKNVEEISEEGFKKACSEGKVVENIGD